MTNCLLSTVNRADAATLTTDSEVTTLPVANLQEPARQVVWRSAASACYLQADLGAAVALDAVALAGLNLAAADTIRLRLSAVSAGAGELLDTGAVASGVVAGYGTWLYVAAATIVARYLRLDFAVAAPLAYVQAGRLWAGPAVTPSANYDYGAEDAIADLSQVRRGVRSGRRFVDVGPKIRSFAFVLSNLNAAEGRQTVKDMLLAAGTSQQVLFVPQPDGAYAARETYLGTIEDLRPITHRAHPVRSLPLRVVEDL